MELENCILLASLVELEMSVLLGTSVELNASVGLTDADTTVDDWLCEVCVLAGMTTVPMESEPYGARV